MAKIKNADIIDKSSGSTGTDINSAAKFVGSFANPAALPSLPSADYPAGRAIAYLEDEKKLVVTSNSGNAWVTFGSGAGGLKTFIASADSPYSASPDQSLAVDTTLGAITVNLPQGKENDVITIIPDNGGFEDNNLTVVPFSGDAFQGTPVDETMLVQDNIPFTLQFTTSWQVIGVSNIGSGVSLKQKFSFFSAGALQADELLGFIIATEPLTIPTNMEFSQFRLKAVPTGNIDFDVQSNGVSVGTISFLAGQNTPNSITTTQVDMVIGDYFEIFAPSVPDGTAADFLAGIVGI